MVTALCDGAGPHDQGEVRRYDLGGGAALQLCLPCWGRENQYRWERATHDDTTGRRRREPLHELWPQQNWDAYARGMKCPTCNGELRPQLEPTDQWQYFCQGRCREVWALDELRRAHAQAAAAPEPDGDDYY